MDGTLSNQLCFTHLSSLQKGIRYYFNPNQNKLINVSYRPTNEKYVIKVYSSAQPTIIPKRPESISKT